MNTADVAALAAAIDHEAEIRYRRVLAQEAALARRERSWSEGYAAAVADVKREQHELVRGIQLEAGRVAPGGPAWLAAVDRHGGTEYGGTGRPRVAVRREAIERARRGQEGRPR